MMQDERKGWLHAAYKALADVPANSLESAVRDAMKTVDHPSKIVPAIRKALEGPGRYQSMVTMVTPSHDDIRRMEEDRRPSPNAKEMAELMRGLRERLEANSAGDAA
jgi:hypothetical protein